MPREALHLFHPVVSAWFREAFAEPTPPQRLGWPAIARRESTLILAPTGTGKTLAAFLWCLNRLMFGRPAGRGAECRVVYVSPLKALAVDVERNLRQPLAGLAQAAERAGTPFHAPAIAVRTGDTPAAERARFQRQPADVLITTPESFYLLLTSNARERLRSVETVIVDEIHALVSTKRGAHLALSLERLERLVDAPLQRIGLSATQRPLEEVARFLGGALADEAPRHGRTTAKSATPPVAAQAADALHEEFADGAAVKYRPVTIVDASAPKALDIRVQLPVEDMSPRPGEDAAAARGVRPEPGQTIWTAIHPQLLDLVRRHRSTLLFVNNRRLAERLAAALNELAGEPLVRAHHGSLARAQRLEIEEQLKSGSLKGLVATSSLELGIDMGAIDLVVQIEAPPSVASGLQRIGRAGHRIDDVSRGVIFPKFRGDLVACAAVTRAMLAREVEPSRYPRNALDVLAQQIVAMAAMDRWTVDDLFRTVRGAAPYAGLRYRVFEGVLDMLSGRYPSDEFAELRPRLTWDRARGIVQAREGARRVAIANAGTIPDRGLFGVFLAGADRDRARVGELDEEMVFETRPGETFVLGASTWRVEEITHDRVLVSPAPGEPGKMPFWKGEAGNRPIELGLSIGRLVRELRQAPREEALARLTREHRLAPAAAAHLLDYLEDQRRAAGVVPDDRTLVVERCRDELGAWRVCVLSPLGSRVHVPWAMAATARIRDERGIPVESLWTDDGFVLRFPDMEAPPDPAWLTPDPEDVERLLMRELGATALFASRFREAAARALLLPRRRPGGRTPLWQQRRRAADLLSVASRFGSFPIVLETYRECLRDVFDLPALAGVLRRIRGRSLKVVTVDSTTPSPFAASVLFGYVANYIYEGDAPLAERRAHALAVDQAELRELIGDAELRDLFDANVIESLEAELQHLPERYHARSADAVHDLLLRLGDLSADEVAARATTGAATAGLRQLTDEGRALAVTIAGERRFIAAEDAARVRDALGTTLPASVPAALLEPVADPLGDLLRRYARTHGPFTSEQVASRFGLGAAIVDAALGRLAGAGRLAEGAFRPHGRSREWCDQDVLRTIRRRTLARLRKDVEPVDAAAAGRFIVGWHGVTRRREGLDALLDTIEQLQGAPLVASLVESEILPARLAAYRPADLDTLMGAGEVMWVGLEPLGERDGRIAFYLTDRLRQLRPPGADPEVDGRERDVLTAVRQSGASFFATVHEAVGGGFPQETLDALWSLVWKGLVTNDTLHALRAYLAPPDRARRSGRATPFRTRRLVPPSAAGRWSALPRREADARAIAEWSAAIAQQLLARHGLVAPETAGVEQLPGGFSAVYPALARLEETGRVRRGYFVAGLGAAQFAQPGAIDALRSVRDAPEGELDAVTLAATDPANPYGALLPWPAWPMASSAGTGSEDAAGPSTNETGAPGSDIERSPGRRLASRSAGARVIIVAGRLAAWIARGDRQLLVDLPADEPDRSRYARRLAAELVALARRAPAGQRGWLIEEVNGRPAEEDPVAAWLVEAGFRATARGLQLRVPRNEAEATHESAHTG